MTAPSFDKQRRDKLRRLVELCAVDRTPDDLDAIYVEPVESAAENIRRRIEALGPGEQHWLIIGGRGCGKSTEIRRLNRLLSGSGSVQSFVVDLDAARVNAADVTAFDLCYLIGLSLVGSLDGREREAAYRKLSAVYFGKDATPALEQQLGALGRFAEGAGTVGSIVVGSAGGAPVAAAGLGLAAAAAGLLLRDRGKREVVHENSPAANAMLAAITEIHASARQKVGQPFVALVDGLEKMNGEAAERFRDVFERTLLLPKLPFAFVIAAPPSSMTKVTTLPDLGYQPVEVWSFTGRPGAIGEMIKKRIRAAGLDAEEVLPEPLCRQVVAWCGGHARTAMYLMREAIPEMIVAGRSSLAAADLDKAHRVVGRRLNSALTGADARLLAGVRDSGMMACTTEADEDRASRLFESSQILAVPPSPPSTRTLFRVHPLVESELPP